MIYLNRVSEHSSFSKKEHVKNATTFTAETNQFLDYPHRLWTHQSEMPALRSLLFSRAMKVRIWRKYFWPSEMHFCKRVTSTMIEMDPWVSVVRQILLKRSKLSWYLHLCLKNRDRINSAPWSALATSMQRTWFITNLKVHMNEISSRVNRNEVDSRRTDRARTLVIQTASHHQGANPLTSVAISLIKSAKVCKAAAHGRNRKSIKESNPGK